MWFKEADPKDLSFLNSYEIWGGVPSAPVKLPGLGRYGRYQFDKRLLLSRCDLTIAQKRELIFLSQHFHKLDHFEFFDLGPEADERTLKKAFFKFSREYHPDALRAKALAQFEEAARLVFEYGAHLYELLSQDEPFRDAYARVVHLRDQAFLQDLEEARAAQRKERPATQDPSSSPGSLPADPAQSAARKEALRARLKQNQARHQSAMESRGTPLSSRPENAAGGSQDAHGSDAKTQAARFFQAGVIAEKRKQWVSARGHFKLAVQFAPETLEYQAGLERVSAVLDELRADELWTQAERADQQEPKRGAQPQWRAQVASLFEESLSLKLDPDRVISFANLCAAKSLYETASPWLIKAIAAHPLNFNLKWALVQSHERVGEYHQARELCREILSHDPAEPRASAFLKKYSG